MKILKRHNFFYQFLIFLVFTFLFLYTNMALTQGKSVFQWGFFEVFLAESKVLVFTLALSLITTFKLKKASLAVSILFFIMVTFQYIILLTGDFNKLVLLNTFLFVGSSYYFLQRMQEELKSAYLNPRADLDDYYEVPGLKIPVLLKDKGGRLDEYSGTLTSWDKGSVSIKLQEEFKSKDEVYDFLVDFEGQEFKDRGKIFAYSQEQNIAGVKLEGSSRLNRDWSELYQILDDRGYNGDSLT